MPPEVILFLCILLFGIAGTILFGQRMQYRHEERLEKAGDPEALERLERAVEELQAEVESLQEGAADFDARLEFNERLLAAPRDVAGPEGGGRATVPGEGGS